MLTGIWVIAVGAVLALIGFGRLGLSTDALENEAFNRQWGMVCRIAGPALFLVGLGILVSKFGVVVLACVFLLAGIAILAYDLLTRHER